MVLQEYARARAGNAGMGEVGVVTVWERPTRVALTAFILLACGVLPGHADLLATLGAVGWIGLGAIGLAQLLLVVHRRLA
jgi:CDP-diacylglycerol--glycerol-3-phosphate 3-phosphatidyltransferase